MQDSTLSALFPAHPIQVGGERLTLRPVTVGELPAVDRVWNGWQLLLATGGTFLDAAAWREYLHLLGSAVGKPAEWVEQLPTREQEALLAQVLAANSGLFGEGKDSAGEVMKWATIAQKLVEHGHPWQVVQGYTLGQVSTFLEAIAEQEREAFAQEITAASFSMVAPKDAQSVAERVRHGKG